MNLDFSPEDLAFRDEARRFIAENYPANLRDKQLSEDALSKDDYLAWHKILAKKGWVAPGWPKEWGGPGWTPTQKYIWSEEQARADTIPILPFGINMVSPVIYTFGTQAQKERFLKPTYNGDIWWCQGYSEPGSGSDLASLRTRAVREGDYYIVNGQKTWTTLGQFADWGFFLVRTDPDAKPQSGISFLLIDMKTPGITVRPIITLGGEHEVNDVFLDNVKVPVENRIFEENQGWTRPSSSWRMSAAASPASPAPSAASSGCARWPPPSAPTTMARCWPTPSSSARWPARDRPDCAGIHRAAHPGRRGRGQGAWAGIFAAQDQGHRDPAAGAGAGPGGRRPLRRALFPRLPH